MKRINIVLFSLLITISSSAQSWSAFPWVRTSRGAADLAMAGAASMSSNNMAWAADGNSAMVPFCSDRMAVELGYMLYQPSGTNYVNAVFAYNVKGKIGVSASLSYGADPAYDIYNDSGKATGKYAPGQMKLGVGVAWRFVDFLSAGLNLRYAMQTLAPQVANNAFAADFVLMGKFGDFAVSAGALNFGTPVKSFSGQLFFPAASVKLAGMYDAVYASAHGLQINIDADYYLNNSFTAALGAQYGWKDMLFVRAGYRYAAESCPLPSFASVGLGCKFKGVRIDLTYLAWGTVKNTFNLGVGYSF